ncbi:MAG: malto-oligosyltrehalose trehalohydrolase [Candidatus Polarisedimenticolia bacterium]
MPPPGATLLPDGRCHVRVWAPRRSRIDLLILSGRERGHRLEPVEAGWHEAIVEGVSAGDRYQLVLDGAVRRPDPASRLQPDGVHEPSEIVSPAAPGWDAPAWRGLPLERCVLYELHVGTFTPEGTFDAVIPRLDQLRALGVTFIELMPVAAFPGARNWGYDGVQPYAVHAAYGGPAGLRRLVAAAHRRGLAVALDVVYNHLGPEGNYLDDFGPYASDRYRTPWGAALNFDGPYSDEVRRHFIGSALEFVEHFGIDMLRVDAVHGIVDLSARPFLAELCDDVAALARRLGRLVPVVAESDLNDVRVLRTEAEGGYGFEAQWSDDFHHALHVLVTGERAGYYQDFEGIDPLRRSLEEGFVYSGQRSAHRRRRHGNDARGIAPGRLVVFAQNHDQVGNRMRGDRLSSLVSREKLKLVAAATLLSPFIPLLFMGEEYGETAPFLYFVSHGDPGLIEAVRRGRREEFASFGWEGEVPDPQAEETFRRSRLDWTLLDRAGHRELLAYHAELLGLRRELPPLARLSREGMEVGTHPGARALWVRRAAGGQEALLALNFEPSGTSMRWSRAGGPWTLRLDSASPRWGGPGSRLPALLPADQDIELSPDSAALYVR